MNKTCHKKNHSHNYWEDFLNLIIKWKKRHLLSSNLTAKLPALTRPYGLKNIYKFDTAGLLWWWPIQKGKPSDSRERTRAVTVNLKHDVLESKRWIKRDKIGGRTHTWTNSLWQNADKKVDLLFFSKSTTTTSNKLAQNSNFISVSSPKPQLI